MRGMFLMSEVPLYVSLSNLQKKANIRVVSKTLIGSDFSFRKRVEPNICSGQQLLTLQHQNQS